MKRATVFAFLAAILLCAVCLIWTTPLLGVDWRLPFYSGGDSLLSGLLANTLIEHPWYLTNSRLGAPGELNWYDFPLSESLHLALLKIVTCFTSSYGLAMNVFYLLGFFLTTCTSLAVLRKLGLSYSSAIAGALLFAFAPYHFYRNELHIFLSGYYIIPLTTLVLLWVFRREQMLQESGWIPRFTTAGATSSVICILTACSGVYYAFFAVVFMLGVGLHHIVMLRSLRTAKAAFVLASITAATLLMNVSPTIVYAARHGGNPAIAGRNPFEAESYGLKIVRMLLPIVDHRLPPMRRIRSWHGVPSENEADFSSLGIVAATGLCILFCGALVGFPPWKRKATFDGLSFLTILAILIGVSGGLGPVFAYFVSPQIRAYTRISIYIAFFSVAGFFIACEAVVERVMPARFGRIGRSAVLFGVAGPVLAIGILDQTSVPDAASVHAAHVQIRLFEQFIASIENSLPPGAMVLQLPYMPYPESGPINGMSDYDPIGAYLASKKLRWSYGATHGRFLDNWLSNLTSRPLEELPDYAVLAGYEGIYVDRAGYRNASTEAENPLRSVLNEVPLQSFNGRFAFYDLRPYANGFRSMFSAADWQRAQEVVRNPILSQITGCSGVERDANLTWRWCGSWGNIVIDNPTATTRLVKIDGNLAGAVSKPAHIRVDGPGVDDRYVISATAPAHFQENIGARPGRTVIRVTSDGEPLIAPGDPRRLVMRFLNLSIRIPADKLETSWGAGCYGLERDSSISWHWCSSNGELIFRNPGSSELPVPFRLGLATLNNSPSTIRIDGPDFSERLTINAAPLTYHHLTVLPPGESRLRFSSDAKRAEVPGDPRTLVFRILNFHIENPALETALIDDR